MDEAHQQTPHALFMFLARNAREPSPTESIDEVANSSGSNSMPVARDSFAMFKEPGFLVALAIILLFEAAFGGVLLALTS